MGLLGPAGTPSARVQVLNHALHASLAQVPLRHALDDLGIEAMDGPPAAFWGYVVAELRRHSPPR